MWYKHNGSKSWNNVTLKKIHGSGKYNSRWNCPATGKKFVNSVTCRKNEAYKQTRNRTTFPENRRQPFIEGWEDGKGRGSERRD